MNKRLFVITPVSGAPKISCLSPTIDFGELDTHGSIRLPDSPSKTDLKSSMQSSKSTSLLTAGTEREYHIPLHTEAESSLDPFDSKSVTSKGSQAFLEWHYSKKQWQHGHAHVGKRQETEARLEDELDSTRREIEQQWDDRVENILQEEESREHRRWHARHDIRSRAMYVSEKRMQRKLAPISRQQLVLR